LALDCELLPARRAASCLAPRASSRCRMKSGEPRFINSRRTHSSAPSTSRIDRERVTAQNLIPSALLRKRVSGDIDRQASAKVSINLGLHTCLLLSSMDVPRSFSFKSSTNS